MATVINNPPNNQGAPAYQTVTPASEGTGVGGVLLTIVLVAILFFLLIVYGLPALRGSNRSTAPAPAPSQQGSDVNVDIPDKIDVNVKK
jgi:hypothetical protein